MGLVRRSCLPYGKENKETRAQFCTYCTAGTCPDQYLNDLTVCSELIIDHCSVSPQRLFLQDSWFRYDSSGWVHGDYLQAHLVHKYCTYWQALRSWEWINVLTTVSYQCQSRPQALSAGLTLFVIQMTAVPLVQTFCPCQHVLYFADITTQQQ